MRAKFLLSIVTFTLIVALTAKENPALLIDTLNITEIEIVKNRADIYSDNIHLSTIDTFLTSNYSNSSVGEILSLTSNIRVHSIGSGGMAASSIIRGSNAYHTSVNWNGFPINSATLGTFDLSQVNTGSLQEIKINHGASSTLYGSGTFGGAIDLNNKPDWDNRLKISVLGKYGSFEDYYSGGNIAIGNRIIQSNTTIQMQDAKLEFPYHDDDSETKYLRNNHLKSANILQNIFIRKNQNYIDLGIWYSTKYKEIPNIGGNPAYNVQRDSIQRYYLKYKRLFSSSILQLNTAYVAEYQKYAENHPIKSNQAMADINYRYYFSEHLVAELGYIFNRSKAYTQYYSNWKSDISGAALAGFKIAYPRFVSTIFYRNQYHSEYKVKPLLSVNLSHNIVGNSIKMHYNLSRNFRAPTMNDRYWYPGNPNLKSENGWSKDIGFQLNKAFMQQEIKFKTVIYSSRINNYIQWFPTIEDPSLWRAENAKEVWLRGLESSLKYNLTISEFKISSDVYYTHTKSTSTKVYEGSEDELGKQLRYVPLHSAKMNTNIVFRNIYLSINQSYTGSRYINEINNKAGKLSPYSLTGIVVGAKNGFKKINGNLSFGITNLFNINYRLVKTYPMPGRAFYIKYKIDFIK